MQKQAFFLYAFQAAKLQPIMEFPEKSTNTSNPPSSKSNSKSSETLDENYKPENTNLDVVYSPDQSSDGVKGIKLSIIFGALVLSISLVALDLTIIATAIPSITNQFHQLDQVGWYSSSFFLANAAFQSTWGKYIAISHSKPALLWQLSFSSLGIYFAAFLKIASLSLSEGL